MSTDKRTIQEHVTAINACNQRGGRMLSLIDLLQAGSVDLAVAAYLAAVMRSGASLLVGARPGGAGKTAVMCALLNFLPNNTSIQAVDSWAVLQAAQQQPHPAKSCYLAHEIGAGSYYAYLWGEAARAFFALAGQGQLIATNLHADTLEETRNQLSEENGIAPSHLTAVQLKIYLRMRHGQGWNPHRWVSHVYETPPEGAERLIWTGHPDGSFQRETDESAIVSAEEEGIYAEFLSALRQKNTRYIEDVRRALLMMAPRQEG